MEATRLICQNKTGDNTLPAFSDLNHCTIVRAKNINWATKPKPKTTKPDNLGSMVTFCNWETKVSKLAELRWNNKNSISFNRNLIHQFMIIAELPYVSSFLKQTIELNRFELVRTENTDFIFKGREANFISTQDAFKSYRQNSAH